MREHPIVQTFCPSFIICSLSIMITWYLVLSWFIYMHQLDTKCTYVHQLDTKYWDETHMYTRVGAHMCFISIPSIELVHISAPTRYQGFPPIKRSLISNNSRYYWPIIVVLSHKSVPFDNIVHLQYSFGHQKSLGFMYDFCIFLAKWPVLIAQIL